MKQKLFIIGLMICMTINAQKHYTKEVKSIVAEGKLLYKSEMASWYGTDLFMEKYSNRQNIGGYFSYVDKNSTKCVFFSKSENPKVIGTISFDTTYTIENADLNLTERSFIKKEEDLYQIRKLALNELKNDTIFKFYKNTNPNLIPLIEGNSKKVYVLTGPTQGGVVIFGNDYLLTFDMNNKLESKKQLHKNIIPIYYNEKNSKGEKSEEAIHNHLPETGDYITATDICTIMLYEKFAKWKSHTVVSKKYLSIWDCEKDQLTILETDVVKTILDEDKKVKN